MDTLEAQDHPFREVLWEEELRRLAAQDGGVDQIDLSREDHQGLLLRLVDSGLTTSAGLSASIIASSGSSA